MHHVDCMEMEVMFLCNTLYLHYGSNAGSTFFFRIVSMYKMYGIYPDESV